MTRSEPLNSLISLRKERGVYAFSSGFEGRMHRQNEHEVCRFQRNGSTVKVYSRQLIQRR